MDPEAAPPLSGVFTRHRGRLAAAGAMMALSLVVGLWIYQAGDERRGLLHMPADERSALYHETRQSTEALCQSVQAQPWLVDRCRSAAEFLLLFPECDADCAGFAHRYTSQPAR